MQTRTLLLLLACVAASANAADRQWQTLVAGEQRIGYAWHEVRSAPAGRTDTRLTRIFVAQFQRATAVETQVEVTRSPAGAPRSIRVRVTNGAERNGWSGSIAADGRSMQVSATGGAPRTTVGLTDNLVWPDELTGSLAGLAAGTDAKRQIRVLDLSTARPTTAEAERIGGRNQQGLVQVRFTSHGRDGMRPTETWWFDGSGTPVRTQRTMLGVAVLWQPCSSNCDARVQQPLDVMARLVVNSPFRVPPRALQGPLRYVIALTNGEAPEIPVTGEQAVVRDGPRAVVTICSSCGASRPITEAERRLYLAANPWVQSDSREVIAFANRHAGTGSPQQVMTRLVEAVRRHMTGEIDYLGFASASEALRTRAGDCTEYSVLLAAAARARGIPARVVVGLVYSERFSGKKDVFSPHTWVQAWTGEAWESYDAGLGGFDATHIALGVGDGDPRDMDMNPAAGGQWRIEKLGLVQ